MRIDLTGSNSGRGSSQPSDQPTTRSAGRVILLPGITNTTSQLAYLKWALGRQHPHFDVGIFPWGPRFGWIRNLRAYQRNRQTARAVAADLAAYRIEHPEAVIHILGYSGGGGLAVMIAQALPDEVTINRLVLVAPAISYRYPLDTDVLPHVSELLVNFASPLDLQIGAGTRLFGNMDGTTHGGAGAKGFDTVDPKLVQVYWRWPMLAQGHPGNHTAYLSPLWQRRYLLPVFDSSNDPAVIRRILLPHR